MIFDLTRSERKEENEALSHFYMEQGSEVSSASPAFVADLVTTALLNDAEFCEHLRSEKGVKELIFAEFTPGDNFYNRIQACLVSEEITLSQQLPPEDVCTLVQSQLLEVSRILH